VPDWGDKNHDWDAINDCVKIMYDMLEPMQAKEKFGYLRCYMGEFDKDLYRKAYKTCLEKHPHMKQYILTDADYPEWLVGLVPEDECEHPSWWSGIGYKRCSVCMKEEKICES